MIRSRLLGQLNDILSCKLTLISAPAGFGKSTLVSEWIATLPVNTGYSVRVAPRLDIRERTGTFVLEEPRPYFAQLHAYQVMPDEAMLTLQEVIFKSPIEQVISIPGLRVNCAICGEEVMNEREVRSNGLGLCSSCAGVGYYQPFLQQDLIGCNQKLYSTVQKTSHIQSR